MVYIYTFNTWWWVNNGLKRKKTMMSKELTNIKTTCKYTMHCFCFEFKLFNWATNRHVGNEIDFIIKNLQIKINYHRHWWMWVTHDLRNREPIFLSLICLSCETWIANTCFFFVCVYEVELLVDEIKWNDIILVWNVRGQLICNLFFFFPVSKWQQ